MNNDENKFEQIKKSTVNNLKDISLQKKDQTFLINLIELFDLLSPNENEKFLIKLQNQIEKQKNGKIDSELEARIYSLKTQLESQKYYEIKKFFHFWIYCEKEKITIYPKKLPPEWEELINEIKKFENFKFKNIELKSEEKKLKSEEKKLKSEEKKLKSEEKKKFLFFEKIYVTVFKSISKKEKIYNKTLKLENWEEELVKILDTNIFTNITITLYGKKTKL